MSERPPSVSVHEGDVYVIDQHGREVGPLDRYAVVGLIGELAAALPELWPDVEPGWQSDPNREDNSGRIGKNRAAAKPREKR